MEWDDSLHLQVKKYYSDSKSESEHKTFLKPEY